MSRLGEGKNRMTAAEQLEWEVSYQTRIGSLVGTDQNPPGWARDIAEREADEAVESMRKEKTL